MSLFRRTSKSKKDDGLIKTSDLLVEQLVKEGVEYVWALMGEENLDLLESLRASGKIKVITVRHEQAGAFMASCVGRLTGHPGVCVSTLGPGATNFTTGAAYAYLGGFPLLFITGQKGITDTKQGAFQIIDVVEMMRPLTKFTKQITSGNILSACVRKAMRIAVDIKPGPVHIELPEDIASHQTPYQLFEPTSVRRPLPEDKAIKAAIELIKEAKNPIMLVGAGCSRYGAVRALREFVDECGIYVVSTQMGKGVIDERSPYFLGCAALSSKDYVHVAIDLADVIINVGHDTTEKPPFFMSRELGKAKRKVIHVHFRPAFVDNVYYPHVEVVGDVGNSIWQFKQILKANNKLFNSKIFKEIKVMIEDRLVEKMNDSSFPMNITKVIADVRTALPSDGIVSLDNGFYKVWFARLYETHAPNTLLLDNALATMGAGLPVGIAASMVTQGRKVLSVSGDGGWMMNAQELATAVQYNVDLVCLVLNDNAYGMIEWKQNNMGFEKWGLDLHNPDFVKHAESFGAKGLKINSPDELVDAIQSAFEEGGVHVIEVPISYDFATEKLKLVPGEAKAIMEQILKKYGKECPSPINSMPIGDEQQQQQQSKPKKKSVSPTNTKTPKLKSPKNKTSTIPSSKPLSIQKGSKVPFYLGGKAMFPNDDLEVLEKFTNKEYCRIAIATEEHLEEAISLAHGIGAQKMAALKDFERKQILMNVVKKIKERREEFAEILCIEAGKPIKDSRGEVDRMIITFEISAEEATRIYGEYQPLEVNQAASGYSAIVRRFPNGPISMISPFNFPCNLLAHKVAPAIAAGVSFVAKPASKTPLSAILLAEILSQDPLMPKEAFSILPTTRSAGNVLTIDPRFKCLSFTGSPQVGWELKAKSGKKKVVLELGGNAACVVDDLDQGLENIVEQIVTGGFYQSGQSCISIQRLLVHEDIYDQVKDLFVSKVEQLEIGDPKMESVFIGPLISEKDAIRCHDWVKEAENQGGTILCGGEIVDTVFLQPTIVENVPKNSKLYREEVFGPVVGIEKYSDFKQAMDIVNDSIFGLQAGIFTSNINKAHYAYSTIEAGAVCINATPSKRVDSQYYGGVKDSGFGWEGPRAAIHDYTELKSMILKNPGDPSTF